MSDDQVQHKIKAIVIDESGKEVDQATFNVPGNHDFAALKAGTYKVNLKPITDFKYTGQNPITGTVGGCGCLFINISSCQIEAKSSSSSKSSSSQDKNIPIKPIVIPAIAAGILYALDPYLFTLPRSPANRPPTSQRPTNPSSQTPRQSPQASNTSSLNIPALSFELKSCIRNNLESLADIPDFRSLVLPLFDEQITDDEFAERLIFLYEQYDQARSALIDCDIPAAVGLIQDNNNDEPRQQFFYQYVIVSGSTVNIRNLPDLSGTVISQALNGDIYPIDVAEFNSLSEAQRGNIIAGNGWFPIILSTGERGYIYSQYASLYPE